MVTETARRVGVLRRRTAATLVILVVQFLVGMSLNPYVTIPTHHPGASSGPYLSGALSSVLWSFTDSKGPISSGTTGTSVRF